MGTAGRGPRPAGIARGRPPPPSSTSGSARAWPTTWSTASCPTATGYLWLSTNNGLSRFDPRTGGFRKNYDISHGLQSNEFNFGAHYRSAGGELFFGGVNGFNAFHPRRLAANNHVPPVVLTAFLKSNRPVAKDRPLWALEASTSATGTTS